MTLKHLRSNRIPDVKHKLNFKFILLDDAKEILKRSIKERKDLIKFIHHFQFLSSEERKEVCVEIPQFMKPDYKLTGDGRIDHMEEPYAWDVVYLEVINNTKLSKILLKEINWKK